jgi:hypothetical protein
VLKPKQKTATFWEGVCNRQHWMLIRTDHGKEKDLRQALFSNDLKDNTCQDFEKEPYMNILWYNLPYPQNVTHSYLKEPGVPCISVRTVQEGESIVTQVVDLKESSEYLLRSMTIAARTEHDLFTNLYLTVELLVKAGVDKHGLTRKETVMGLYHNSCIAQDKNGPLYVKEVSFLFTEAPPEPVDPPLTITMCSELGLPNEIQ